MTTRVLDRVTGREYTIRSKYLIGADGARSKVAADIGLPMEGRMDIAGSMNITFTADIAELVGHRPSVLYWVIQPGSNVGGIGAGLVRMVRPWNEWLIVWGYDIAEPAPVLDDAPATQIVRNLLGIPDLEVEITGTSLWGNNEMYATQLQSGRVFCAGDAVHRHPPSNGLGSNTSIQDSYNLRLEARRGAPRPGRRRPAGHLHRRARAGREADRAAGEQVGREFGGLFDALGVHDARQTRPRWSSRSRSARRRHRRRGARSARRCSAAMELKHYEFNAHGVELGQFYTSRPRCVSDGIDAARRRPATRSCTTRPSTVPGSPLPHAWVGEHARKLVDPRPRAEHPLHAVHRDRGPGVGGCRARGGGGSSGSTSRRVVIGPGRDDHRPLLRLGADSGRSARTASCWCGPTRSSRGGRCTAVGRPGRGAAPVVPCVGSSSRAD